MSQTENTFHRPALALAALAGALSSAPAAAEPRRPTHVACVGDSITAGSGASSPAKNYPSQLQLLLGDKVSVQNFGSSGCTMLSSGYGDKPYTLDAKYTAATDFVKNAPAGAVVSVVINLGANDSKPQNWEPPNKPKNDQQYLADYRALVDHFLALPSKPVVYVALPLSTGTSPCCSIRGDVIDEQELPLIQQLAAEKRLPVIDLNSGTAGHPEYFGDGVHPNDGGYVVLANLVKAGLEREPTVSITTPAAAATLPSGKLALAAMASGATVAVSSVEFFEGTTSLGKSTAAPFLLDWHAPAGLHSITAQATDTTLASKTSAAVSFTVTDAGAAAGGSAGAAGASGATAGASGATAGASGSLSSTAGSSSVAGAPTHVSGGASGEHGGALPTSGNDAGCSFSVPTSHDVGAGWIWLALAALVSFRNRSATLALEL